MSLNKGLPILDTWCEGCGYEECRCDRLCNGCDSPTVCLEKGCGKKMREYSQSDAAANDAALRSALWAAACGNWYAWEKYIHEWRTSVPQKGNE